MSVLRIYAPEECGADGYPFAWHRASALTPEGWRVPINSLVAEELHDEQGPIKDYIREQADHRCERCHHPYPPGIADIWARGEWTPCDVQCTHGGPFRWGEVAMPEGGLPHGEAPEPDRYAQWRILTVHHLNGVKYDCRWWNLASLCQRCHLTIQGRVLMERVYPLEHSEWFKPHAAGWYAAAYLGEDLTKEETMTRLDELLALERMT